MGFFANGQKSLVPIGGNFFATPDTPADPRDCDRYPNSPYCGGGFLDITPVRIIPQIVADECNLGVAIQGTLGFVRLPVLQVVHRNPACMPPPPPPPPPTPKGDDCQVLYCNDGSSITAVLSVRYGSPGTSGNPGDFPVGTDAQTIMDFAYDLAMKAAENAVRGLNEDAANATSVHPLLKNIRTVVEPFGDPGFHPQTLGLPFFQIATTKDGIINISDDEFITSDNPPTRLSRYDGNIECKYTISKVYFDYLNDDNLGTYNENSYYQTGYWIATRFKNRLCKPPVPPPPPPPKMECCPGQQNNDALLKLILKRIGTLPVDVQTSYLTKNGVQPEQTKSIESLTDFIAWFAERFDETIGEFEITIEVDDADLSKQGNQKQTIRLPNLGESIAEIFSLLIHSKINNDLILNIVNRNLIESGQIKQSEFKTFSALNSLIEYVGFPTNSTTEKMPLTFKPGELSFDKLLKEGEIDVSVLTYTEKNTLAAAMHTLLQAAAIIRAVHFRKTPGNDQQIASTIKKDLTQFLGENGNLSEQVKTFLGNVEKVYDGINNQPS